MSIFNDKALKGVTEAVAKIMEAEKMAKKDHDQDGKIETGKAEYLGSRIRAARLAGKLKEEEQLDELSKSTVKSYVMKKIEKPTTTKKDVKGLTNAYNRLKNYKPTSEAVDLDEDKGDVHVRNKKSGKELMIPATAVKTYEKHGYFPVPGSVREGFDDMEKYRKEKEKESSFEKKKTDKGTAYSRKPEKTEKKVEEGFDDMDKYLKDKNKPQPSGSAGKKPGKAYGGSKQPEEKKSMTEMLELYNEHGLKVLSMMNTKSVKFGDTEVELLDADDVNGFVETVVEEVDNETFTKEVNAQKAKAEGKGKKAEVAKASVQAVKQEEVELGERTLTAAETKEKEMNVKGMKKNLSGFKARYGDKAKSVMYATATKQAKKD
jgi:hypothetical protein